MRDEAMPALGVHVHDEQDGTCAWMVLPPERRQGRRRRLEEEAQAAAAQTEGDGDGNGGVEGGGGVAGGGEGGPEVGKATRSSTLPGDAIWVDEAESEDSGKPGGIPVPPEGGFGRKGG